jgi:uncharacterized protein involved in exopolysaccharide biosynthesis
MQSLPGNAVGIVPVQESSSLRPFVESAFRYRKLWVLIVLSVISMTALYTELIPKQYLSEMDILVQNQRGDYQITPQRTTGTVTVNGVTEEQINSEIELLRSRGIANIVLDPNWNNQSTSQMTPVQLKAHDKAVEQFNKHLSAEMIRKSNVIHVSYIASDPKTARQTLDRLLTAFLAKQREIAQPPGTSQFFASEAARYKKELDQAQQDLAEYQQKQGIVSLSDTEEAVDRQINQAQTDLRSTDAQINEVSQRLSEQARQLKGIPTRQMTLQRTVPNEYSVERLNTMLAELQNQRTSLLQKFTPSDRLVQEVDKQIADTNDALKHAQQMTSQEHTSDVNPVWQELTGSIIHNEGDRQALKARRNALAEQITKLQSNLSGVEGSTVAFTTLRQKVTDLQNNYQLYAQKRDEAQIADAMNENRLLNVAVAQNPTFSIMPYRPNPVVNLVLGAFTAVFLASFMVFFAEMGRSTIATKRDIGKLSRQSVLATLPMEASHRGRRREVGSADSTSLAIIVSSDKSSPSEEELSLALSRYRKEQQAS